MTSQQKIALTLLATLAIKEASGLINCSNPFLIRLIIQSVAKQLKAIQDKCDQYEKENQR